MRAHTPDKTIDSPSRVPEKVITDPDKAPLFPSFLQTAPILGSPVNKFTVLQQTPITCWGRGESGMHQTKSRGAPCSCLHLNPGRLSAPPSRPPTPPQPTPHFPLLSGGCELRSRADTHAAVVSRPVHHGLVVSRVPGQRERGAG